MKIAPFSKHYTTLFVFVLGLFTVLSLSVLPVSSAQAQFVNKTPGKTAVEHARRVASTCLGGRWEQQPCLKAVSENNLVMLSLYIADLQQRRQQSLADQVKNECAASTAASQGEFPAYAMRSAFVTCANLISDVTETSGIQPDLSQYQLLVGAVQCMDGLRGCSAVESGLQRYRR